MDFSTATFFYLKLHGSSNWYTSDKRTMVIGRSKRAQIAGHPLLEKYFDAFQTVLMGKDRKLLRVGYGFCDEHVNAAIRDGIQAGLQLYILSPESPDELRRRLGQQTETSDVIWRGLAGYFQADLKTLFPMDQSETEEWKMLQRSFFA